MSLRTTLLASGALGARAFASSVGRSPLRRLSSRARVVGDAANAAHAPLARPARRACRVAAHAARDRRGSPSPIAASPGPVHLGGDPRRFTTAVARAVAEPSEASSPAPTPPGGDDGFGLRLHDTMRRRKELFVPSDPDSNKVTMYVCGVTVYDYSHIGHARVYVAFDVLYRALTRQGYDVTYCRNFTDVDDKIIARANENGETCDALVERFIDAFHEDVASLGCLPPTLEPRATAHIGDIIDMTERLVKEGFAYPTGDGDVYFAVDALPEYGRLSGRKLEDNRAGERVAVDDRKKNPADFALWKAAKPGEPEWESPWGKGRPGWHIECSAMIEATFGGTNAIDIHGGGQDLVFPHHENELAQSTAACRCGRRGCEEGEGGPIKTRGDGAAEDETPFVRYWVHNGFVKVDSEKMSKSLGNFFTIREVTARYHPIALRWMLLGTHYRAPINYTQRALEEASDRLYYLYQTLDDAAAAYAEAAKPADASAKPKPPTGIAAEGIALAAETADAVRAALADDLNTPLAIASLSAPLKTLNDLVSTKKGKKAVGRDAALRELLAAAEDCLDAVGLPPGSEAGGILEKLRELALIRGGLTAEDVDAAIAAREAARAAKDFEESDRLRDDMRAKGVALMDGAKVAWRPAPVVDDQ